MKITDFDDVESRALRMVNSAVVRNASEFMKIFADKHHLIDAFAKEVSSKNLYSVNPHLFIELQNLIVREEELISTIEKFFESAEKYVHSITRDANHILHESNYGFFDLLGTSNARAAKYLFSKAIIVEKLFNLYSTNILAWRKRLAYEEKLVKHRAIATLHELLPLWKKDEAFFEELASHLLELTKLVKVVLMLEGIVSISSFAFGQANLYVVKGYKEGFDPAIPDDPGKGFFVLLTSASILFSLYNLTLMIRHLLPEERKEFKEMRQVDKLVKKLIKEGKK